MILVTGGAGFIGSHLVRLLVERGERVRVLERPGSRLDHLPLGRIDVVVGDIRDEAAVKRAVSGCREVYHLAANPHLKFFNSQRGYSRVTVDQHQWRNDFRVVPYVDTPGAPISTRATYVVEDRHPHVHAG